MQHSCHFPSSIISSSASFFGFFRLRLILILLTIFIIFVQNSNCASMQQRSGNQRIRALRLAYINNDRQMPEVIYFKINIIYLYN